VVSATAEAARSAAGAAGAMAEGAALGPPHAAAMASAVSEIDGFMA
jgi:hypothetical protein